MFYYDAQGKQYTEAEAARITAENKKILMGDVSEWHKIILLFSEKLLDDLERRQKS